MPWMSENTHEYIPNRSVEKDLVLLARAERLMGAESAEFHSFCNLVCTCSERKVVRDVEFRIMLDTLELISLGVDYETVAKIATDDLLLEVDLGRISPIQACVARDCIQRYTPDDFDFGDLIPGNSFLKGRRRKPAMLEKTPERVDLIFFE